MRVRDAARTLAARYMNPGVLNTQNTHTTTLTMLLSCSLQYKNIVANSDSTPSVVYKCTLMGTAVSHIPDRRD